MLRRAVGGAVIAPAVAAVAHVGHGRVGDGGEGFQNAVGRTGIEGARIATLRVTDEKVVVNSIVGEIIIVDATQVEFHDVVLVGVPQVIDEIGTQVQQGQKIGHRRPVNAGAFVQSIHSDVFRNANGRITPIRGTQTNLLLVFPGPDVPIQILTHHEGGFHFIHHRLGLVH